ncbi:MAG: T9SS type A sorting domain-containing protein [candidate division WOR-3 bacterium]|nr:MAG: T9SS type A sorting domain-containing protein [candidate division WOR-3 bacterium]
MKSRNHVFPAIMCILGIFVSVTSAVVSEDQPRQGNVIELEFKPSLPSLPKSFSDALRPEYYDEFERDTLYGPDIPWTTSGYAWGIRDTLDTYGPNTAPSGYRFAGVPAGDIAMYTGNQTGYLTAIRGSAHTWNHVYLSMDYWSSFEGPATNFDGGIVEISNDSGVTWVQIDSLAEGHLNPTYDAQLAGTGSLGNAWAYCYSTTPNWVSVASQDLQALGYVGIGDFIGIRITFASDPLSHGQGWFIDNARMADTPPPDLQPPLITHTPLPDTIDTLSNYTVTATVTDDGSGVNPDSVILHYEIENGPTLDVHMTSAGPDVYEADIPAQTWHTDIWYSVLAADNAGNWATTATYNFEVTNARTIIYDDGQPYWVPAATTGGDGQYVRFEFSEVGIDSGLLHQVKLLISDPGTFDIRIYEATAGAPGSFIDSVAELYNSQLQWYTVDITDLNIITDNPLGIVVGHIIAPGDSCGVLRDPTLDYPGNMWNYIGGVWQPGVSGDNMIRLKVIPITYTGIAEKPGEHCSYFGLGQISPNPMRTNTVIEYQLTTPLYVSLDVYNVSGQLVRTLVNQYEQIGTHQVTWNSHDEKGRQVASGVYFLKLQAGDNSTTKKLLLVR